MHFFSVLLCVGVSFATASGYSPGWEHFSTEAANKAAPFLDLSAYGIQGGQLPKVYDIRGGNFTYLPIESQYAFDEIKAGLRNRTATPDSTEDNSVDKRTCNDIDLDLTGNCADFTYSSTCVSAGSCIATNSGCIWKEVTVYSVQQAYITFWTSTGCNGGKGSFNPTCDTGSSQSCSLNNNYASFRAYSGCHSQDASNCN